VLCETGQLGIGARRSQYLGVVRSDHSSPLPFEGSRDDRGATRLAAGADDLVDELDQVIGESHRDLLAHPNTVPNWDHALERFKPVHLWATRTCF